MIKKLLFSALSVAALTAGAQLNSSGTGYTLDNTNAASQCNIDGEGGSTNGAIMAEGNSISATGTENLAIPAGGPLVLVSTSSFGTGTPTWFAIPSVSGEACSNLFDQSKSVDMSNDSKVSITVESNLTGAKLELWIGTAGPTAWWQAGASTFNTGDGSSIFAESTLSAANTPETFTFDYAAIDGDVWDAFSAKNAIRMYGFRSMTEGATFKVTEVKFGSDVSDDNGGGATCSDGIQNQDETGVDCGGATCSPCGDGGPITSCANTIKDDGLAQATFYNLLENGSSSTVTCSFDAIADVKGTFYGALETRTLHGTGTAETSFSHPAKYCGICVSMTGLAGTAIVQVVDECPDCNQHNDGDTDIDLSPQAFAAIVGEQSIGRSDIEWNEVSCPWTTDIQIITENSTQWYSKLIIANSVNRVADVQIEENGSWTSLTRHKSNGWEKFVGGEATAVVGGPVLNIKIIDIYGGEVIANNFDVSTNGGNDKKTAGGQFSACTVTAVNELNSLDYISAYPNPANSSITFDGLAGVQSVEIFSSIGESVSTQLLNGNFEQVSVDLVNLTSGIYIAKFTTASGFATKTFVKK